MFVVIFRARIGQLDDGYLKSARSLRETALRDFGCLDFVAVTDGNEEIAISYWPDEASIARWKAHEEHQAAQSAGRQTWYESYSVTVARVERQYQFPRLSPA